MNTPKPKQYCGIGRERETKYGPLVKVSMSKEDVEVLYANLKNGWVSFDVKRRKEIKGDKTHYCEINDFEPKPQEDPPPQVSPNTENQDLPF